MIWEMTQIHPKVEDGFHHPSHLRSVDDLLKSSTHSGTSLLEEIERARCNAYMYIIYDVYAVGLVLQVLGMSHHHECAQ